MIKYQLKCRAGCEFEGWFRSSDDFEAQAEAGRLQCPSCESTDVSRAVMAPAVVRSGAVAGASRASRIAEVKSSMADAARRARDYVEKNFDYVGERFPEEARRIHYGEDKERPIYGEATGKEVKELKDEGVGIAPLPDVATPVDKKKVN